MTNTAADETRSMAGEAFTHARTAIHKGRAAEARTEQGSMDQAGDKYGADAWTRMCGGASSKIRAPAERQQ